jgi:hypothetical protein
MSLDYMFTMELVNLMFKIEFYFLQQRNILINHYLLSSSKRIRFCSGVSRS